MSRYLTLALSTYVKLNIYKIKGTYNYIVTIFGRNVYNVNAMQTRCENCLRARTCVASSYLKSLSRHWKN